MHTNNDTIAAISTPPGRSAISIVRISGPEAIATVDSLFKCALPSLNERDAGTFVRGHIYAKSESAEQAAPIDEVIVLIFRGPHSYTRDDLLEIQCHGGHHSATQILEALIASGARPADPGEFTRRAFLSGRIDLTQAEAVLDIINAQTRYASSAAVSQLRGDLSSVLTMGYDTLVSALATTEASLDFPDEDVPEGLDEQVMDSIKSTEEAIAGLIETWHEGQLLRDGIRVVIAGRPNAGKSTLLNALARTERAIVTSEPGTTRDTVSIEIDVDGYPVQLIDTAGLRDPGSEAETMGIERARLEISAADHIVYLMDGSQPPHPDDISFLSEHADSSLTVILNKTDLGAAKQDFPTPRTPVTAALVDGTGLQDIHNAISSVLANHDSSHPHATVSARHKKLLVEANEALERMARGSDLEILASELRASLDCLSRILGKTYDTEVLDAIFGRFCIGK